MLRDQVKWLCMVIGLELSKKSAEQARILIWLSFKTYDHIFFSYGFGWKSEG